MSCPIKWSFEYLMNGPMGQDFKIVHGPWLGNAVLAQIQQKLEPQNPNLCFPIKSKSYFFEIWAKNGLFQVYFQHHLTLVKKSSSTCAL